MALHSTLHTLTRKTSHSLLVNPPYFVSRSLDKSLRVPLFFRGTSFPLIAFRSVYLFPICSLSSGMQMAHSAVTNSRIRPVITTLDSKKALLTHVLTNTTHIMICGAVQLPRGYLLRYYVSPRHSSRLYWVPSIQRSIIASYAQIGTYCKNTKWI